LAPSPSSSFWGSIAAYARELAPVAGPLLEAIGQTAGAIERVEQSNRCLEAALADENDGIWS
jgi:hypothetical protein